MQPPLLSIPPAKQQTILRQSSCLSTFGTQYRPHGQAPNCTVHWMPAMCSTTTDVRLSLTPNGLVIMWCACWHGKPAHRPTCMDSASAFCRSSSMSASAMAASRGAAALLGAAGVGPAAAAAGSSTYCGSSGKSRQLVLLHKCTHTQTAVDSEGMRHVLNHCAASACL